jgi:hypothetical protein
MRRIDGMSTTLQNPINARTTNANTLSGITTAAADNETRNIFRPNLSIGAPSNRYKYIMEVRPGPQ